MQAVVATVRTRPDTTLQTDSYRERASAQLFPLDVRLNPEVMST